MSENFGAMMTDDTTTCICENLLSDWSLMLSGVKFCCSNANGQHTVKVTFIYLDTNCILFYIFLSKFLYKLKQVPRLQVLENWQQGQRILLRLKPGVAFSSVPGCLHGHKEALF